MIMLIALLLLGVAAVVVVLAAVHFAGQYGTTRPPVRRDSAALSPSQVTGRIPVFGKPVPPRTTSTFFKRYAAERGPTLSIVVPCFNEEDRLPAMLSDTFRFCEGVVAQCGSDEAAREQGLFSDYELILVDDHSRDGTLAVMERFRGEHPDALVSIVPLSANRGKGHAVRTGFYHARGDYVLMADADGASNIRDVRKLFRSLRRPLCSGKPPSGLSPAAAVGSRAHLEQTSIAQRSFVRTVLMKTFHLVVWTTYLVATRRPCPIRDTQCGFKLFNRRQCSALFLSNRIERWAFDVELLVVAQRLGLQVAEVPVEWAEIAGSKVNLHGMVQMGLECVMMCVAFPLGLWPVVRN